MSRIPCSPPLRQLRKSLLPRRTVVRLPILILGWPLVPNLAWPLVVLALSITKSRRFVLFWTLPTHLPSPVKSLLARSLFPITTSNGARCLPRKQPPPRSLVSWVLLMARTELIYWIPLHAVALTVNLTTLPVWSPNLSLAMHLLSAGLTTCGLLNLPQQIAPLPMARPHPWNPSTWPLARLWRKHAILMCGLSSWSPLMSGALLTNLSRTMPLLTLWTILVQV